MRRISALPTNIPTDNMIEMKVEETVHGAAEKNTVRRDHDLSHGRPHRVEKASSVLKKKTRTDVSSQVLRLPISLMTSIFNHGGRSYGKM